MNLLTIAAALLGAQISSASPAVDFDGRQRHAVYETALAAQPVPAVPAAAREPKEWTVMVYINAKNNLEYFGLKDVNEMEAVGSTDKVNIVVELGRMKGYSTDDGDWTGVRRYLVTKDKDAAKINSPVLMDLGQADMGDWRSLASFGAWARGNFPAKHYMLIVWNHGSGWIKSAQMRGISYDSDTGSHITITELGQALQSIGKVDLYASDACLMQMAEVVYELKDRAGLILGSEETEPGDGYNYTPFLSRLAAAPQSGAVELGKFAAEAYSKFYSASGDKYTISLVDPSKADGLKTLLDGWIQAALASGDGKALAKARDNADKYDYPDNKDIYDFMRLAAKYAKNPALVGQTQQIMAYVKSMVIVSYSGNHSGSNGLAIYLPSSYYMYSYDETLWSKDSAWDEFVRQLFSY